LLFEKEKIAFDSGKVRIPMRLVTVLKPELTQKYVLIGEDFGDIDETVTKKGSWRVQSNNYSTRYHIHRQGNKHKQMEDFLVIQLNAKILEKQYLEGITLDNIELVYKRLLEQKVVWFNYNDFLHNSGCTDTDLKYDFSLMEGQKGEPIKLFSMFTKQLHYLTEDKYKVLCRRIQKKNQGRTDNQGIEWNTRPQATDRKPYVKIYNKTLELKYKQGTKQFAEEYLTKEAISEQRYRLEVTIKNNKHWKWHKVKDNSLFGILSLTPEHKYNILTKCIMLYLRDAKPKQVRTVNTDLNMNDTMLVLSMNYMVDKGEPYHFILDYLTSTMRKDTRSKAKKKLVQLYAENISNEKPIDYNLNVSGWFSLLGIAK